MAGQNKSSSMQKTKSCLLELDRQMYILLGDLRRKYRFAKDKTEREKIAEEYSVYIEVRKFVIDAIGRC